MKKIMFLLLLSSSPAYAAEPIYSTFSHEAADGNVDIAIHNGGLKQEASEAVGMGRTLAIKVTDSYGGLIDKFIELRQEFVTYNVRVELSGFCNSSCTMYSGLKNVCVMPDMVFGFHQASDNIGTNMMMAKVAPEFRKYFKKVKLPTFESRRMFHISGEQAIMMGAVKACAP